MTTAKYTRPDFTLQSAAQYKANIDAMARVFERSGAWFAPHEQDQGSPAPEMSVRIDAGAIFDGTTLTEVAAQTVAGFTTPSGGQTRVDRIVINPSTGVATRVAGTAVSGSPSAVAPAITNGTFPICQVAFVDSSTTVTNSMITDERALPFLSTASQAQMESASTFGVFVSPGRQQFHPSAAKCWGSFDGGAAIPSFSDGRSYNCDGISDNGTGSYTITLTNDFVIQSPDGSYAVFVHGTALTDVNVDQGGAAVNRGAGSFRIDTENAAGSQIDMAQVDFVAFGDQ